MSVIKRSPDDIRKNISWPSGPPSRLLLEEEVNPPPDSPVHRLSGVVTARSVEVGSKTSPGNYSSPPIGRVKQTALSLSGDPGYPRPPTRREFVELLKGCDALFSRKEK